MDYDSILTAVDSTAINRSEFYHSGENAPDLGTPMVGRLYGASSDDWIIGVSLIATLLLAIVVYRNKTYYLFSLKNFFSSGRLFSEEAANTGIANALNVFTMVSVTAISLSLIFFRFLSRQMEFSTVLGIPYWLLGAVYILFMLFLYARAWLHALVGWVFFNRDSASDWMTSFFFLNSITAFVIFPLSQVCIFSDLNSEFTIWFCLFVLFIYELALIFKLFTNFNAKNRGYVLIFLYFCSVELLPALVLGKFLQDAALDFLQTYILN